MRKLFEIEQDNLIVCDNKLCNYKIPNVTKDPYVDIKEHINMPCPDCGDNLLTQEDYNNYIKTLRVIKFMNRWFSWLTIFSSKKKKPVNAIVNTHKGISIEVNDKI